MILSRSWVSQGFVKYRFTDLSPAFRPGCEYVLLMAAPKPAINVRVINC